MREKGEVTVFLAMILVMIMTLLLVMAESARISGAAAVSPSSFKFSNGVFDGTVSQKPLE